MKAHTKIFLLALLRDQYDNINWTCHLQADYALSIVEATIELDLM